jgi:DNA invertase Pin-like site-specific DNA recombinase
LLLADELVVLKLDRLGRNTRDVLNLVHDLRQRGAVLSVLEPKFATTDVAGPILVTVLGMVAELERSFIRERQKARASQKPRPMGCTRDGSRQFRSSGSGRCTGTALVQAR